MKTEQIRDEVKSIFARFGLSEKLVGELVVNTPLTGEEIAFLKIESTESIDCMLQKAQLAQESWKEVKTKIRGEFLEYLGSMIAANSVDLSKLVHYDSGKSRRESTAEVASTVGLINGTVKAASYETLPSGPERSKEFTPLGVVAIISPFNFALAIGMWTGVPALLAGNTVVNKPSENASLTPVLYEAIFEAARHAFNARKGGEVVPAYIFQVAVGGPETGKALLTDQRVAKVIFTGSIAGCEKVKESDGLTRRRHSALTEGGAANYAVISDQHAGMTTKGYVQFVVGAIMKSYLPYAGQKCINTRQTIVHQNLIGEVIAEFRNQLEVFREKWRIESAFDEENPFEFTPLINQQAGERFQWALKQTIKQGGELIGGEQISTHEFNHAQYFMPAVAVFKEHVSLMDEEIFGPFIMVVSYKGTLNNAIALGQKPNANLVNAYYGSDAEEANTFIRDSTAGFALINPPLGTGLLPLYGLGFGGNGLSGQGESLPRDPLLPFVDLAGPIRRSVAFKLAAAS